MAQFNESRVINALHKDKAEIGKKYYYSDELLDLRGCVINGVPKLLTVLSNRPDDCYPFVFNDIGYQFIYPYEEPPRMTNRMLSEWCNRGNGEYSYRNNTMNYTEYRYEINEAEDDEVNKGIIIRPWDSKEWIEPTVDIYERDCKGGKE